jgi:hypothetical protein
MIMFKRQANKEEYIDEEPESKFTEYLGWQQFGMKSVIKTRYYCDRCMPQEPKEKKKQDGDFADLNMDASLCTSSISITAENVTVNETKKTGKAKK